MKLKEKIGCKFFKGNIPCEPHKQKGVHCTGCAFYEQISQRILIIKLGAAGDVLRTTPLLHRLKKIYSNAEITWLTYFPGLVPSAVDNVTEFNLPAVVWLLSCEFDLLINLDKDKEAIALADLINAKVKKGFTAKRGKAFPVNSDAIHKWRTGLWDDVEMANIKSYPQEIFEICGFKFNHEKYIIDKPRKLNIRISGKRPLIGLNTGCGSRWLTRAWPATRWIELVKKLKKGGFGTILLGGEQEDKLNKEIAAATRTDYAGFFPIEEFVSLVNECDMVVTTVTMALHIAIALEKKIVLLNNVFNRQEFELYGLGKIIEPPNKCLGCYKARCEKMCMKLINAEEVYNACKKILKY